MSAATAPARAAAPSHDRPHVTQTRVIRSEWSKLWTLRSTRWSFVAAVVATIGLPITMVIFLMTNWWHLEAHDRTGYDAIDNAVAGYHLSMLAIGILGVLVITGEYSTGMIRSTLMAVPKRLPVLWAKLAVFCSVTFVLTLVGSFIAFFVVQAIATQHHVQASLSDPGALRCVIGVALFITALGALAVALGTLIRSTAGGIGAFVGLLFVLPGITSLLPRATSEAINPYMPMNAGSAVATSSFEPFHSHLAPWTGFGVFCLYVAIAIGAAAVQLVRRDA